MKRNKLLSIFMFVVSLFVVCGNVKAEKSIKIIDHKEYPEVKIYNDSNYSNMIRRVNIIKEESGSRLYCMDMGATAPGNGVEMYSDGPLSKEESQEYAYIIKNISTVGQASTVKYQAGTEATGFTPDNLEPVSKDYLKTQFAIWYYQKENNNTIRDNNGNPITDTVLAMYPGIDTLVSKAVSEDNPYKKDLTVTITGNASMKLSDDKKFYESEKLTVTSSRGGKVTLSMINNGIEGIEIYNEKGNKVNEVTSGSKVIIKVPVESLKLGVSSFKLNAEVTGEEYAMYEYTSKTNPSIQSVGKLESEPISESTSKEFSIDKKSTTKFSKISVVNQKELPGATLRILDENKELLMDPDGNAYEWVSTDEPHYIEGLPAGKYYLEERIAEKCYDFRILAW